MLYTILFLLGWNLILALAISYIDSEFIKQDTEIKLSMKNKRAFIIFGTNFILAFILKLNYDLPIFQNVVLALLAQTFYGIFFDSSLNFRRFGFKGLLYTSNNGDDLNDALLDRLFNKLAHPYSGIFQLLLKFSVLYILITQL